MDDAFLFIYFSSGKKPSDGGGKGRSEKHQAVDSLIRNIEGDKRKVVHAKTTVGLSSNPPHTARSENIQRPTGTADSSTAPPRRDETHDSTTTSMQAPLAYSEMGMPFTEAELTLALTRTSIRS